MIGRALADAASVENAGAKDVGAKLPGAGRQQAS
jgi:hypothetical protein